MSSPGYMCSLFRISDFRPLRKRCFRTRRSVAEVDRRLAQEHRERERERPRSETAPARTSPPKPRAPSPASPARPRPTQDPPPVDGPTIRWGNLPAGFGRFARDYAKTTDHVQVAPLEIILREGQTARRRSIGSSARPSRFGPCRFPAVHRRLSAPPDAWPAAHRRALR